MEHYWHWVAATCYLLFTVDLLTTYFAAAVVGIDGESNPIVAQALSAGPLTLVALNLGGLVVAVLLFYILRETVVHATPLIRPYYARFVAAWIASLILLGFVIFVNNLSVIVYQRSLLAAALGV